MLPLLFLLACETEAVVTLGPPPGWAPPDTAAVSPAVEEEEEPLPEEDSAQPVEEVGGIEQVGGSEDTAAEEEPEEPEERLYVVSEVGTLALELDDEEWRDLRVDPTSWTTATLVSGEERLIVGVRLKGSSTWSTLEEKPSWKVDVDRVVEDQTFLGHGEFNLHNQVLDPSVMSEALSFGAYRALGIPAPRVGYLRLTVNDEDYGLYTVVEPPNRDFLRIWFGDDEGNLYENSYQDCEVTDPDCFDVEQNDLESTDDLDEVRRIARLEGDAWREAMQELFDWDAFLGAMAMEAMIAHWDGYSYDLSNYRLFHSADNDRMYFLPWSADLDFAYRPWSFPECGQYATDPSDYDDGVLALRCERDETCHQALVDRMEVLVDAWEATDPLTELERLRTMLRPEVMTDSRRYYDEDDFDDHVDCVSAWIAQRPDELREWIAAQRAQ